QTLGVRRRRRRYHLEARDVTQPAFPRLRVLRAELEGRAIRPPEHDRNGELAARLVQQLRRRVDDLVEGEHREVPRHELDHRAEPGRGWRRQTSPPPPPPRAPPHRARRAPPDPAHPLP